MCRLQFAVLSHGVVEREGEYDGEQSEHGKEDACALSVVLMILLIFVVDGREDG